MSYSIRLWIIVAIVFALWTLTLNSYASSPKTGKEAAQRYFASDTLKESKGNISHGRHYMTLHLGSFLESDAYAWGSSQKETNTGKSNFGVTYLIGEWSGSMDLMFRMDFSSYELDHERPTKLSFMPIITFPEIASRFPIYFGAGAGLGVYFKQIKDKSSLSLDYQLLTGVRFLNLIDNVGFFIETGLKNHFHLLSEGQFNSVFFAFGTAFIF